MPHHASPEDGSPPFGWTLAVVASLFVLVLVLVVGHVFRCSSCLRRGTCGCLALGAACDDSCRTDSQGAARTRPQATVLSPRDQGWQVGPQDCLRPVAGHGSHCADPP